jgi:hypothetical protein
VNNCINQELDFDQFLVSEYFRLGSINKVFEEHKYNLPISFAGYDRLLNKYGVVKSAGPNSKLSESLYVMSLLANYKIPLEKIYHRFAPRSVQVSTNTLHRILHYTRLGLTRRQAAGLIITPQGFPNKVLMGYDLSLKNSELGNKGDVSLPMSHSKLGESVKDTIARIMQNEVFTNEVINQKFPWELIPKHIKPIVCVNVADILVSIYKLEIPVCINSFSSFKLNKLKFYDLKKLPKDSFRPGIKDILTYYENSKNNSESRDVPVINSELNTQIFALAKRPVE